MSEVKQNNEAYSADGDTRRKILLILLEHAPVIASDIAEQLRLSTAGVRRHLDNLVEEGLAEAADPRQNPYEPKMRGRPAKTYRLTDKGRSIFGHEYDSLAVSALTTLREIGGEEAVRKFAQKRIEAIVQGVVPADVSDQSIEDTAKSLVEAFGRHGYAATVEATRNGLQICQHHCPISTVATEFPELCEAEHQAVSELLGQHTQPLATIADGHGICTTNIPLTPIKHS